MGFMNHLENFLGEKRTNTINVENRKLTLQMIQHTEEEKERLKSWGVGYVAVAARDRTVNGVSLVQPRRVQNGLFVPLLSVRFSFQTWLKNLGLGFNWAPLWISVLWAGPSLVVRLSQLVH